MSEKESERTRLVLESLADPVTIINENREVSWMNRAARELLTKKGSPLKYMLCYQCFHGRQTPCDEAICPMEKVRKSGTPYTMTHEHVLPDGERRFFEITAAPIKSEDGTFKGIVESMRDVTERMKSWDELKLLNEKLKQNNREKEMLLRELYHRTKNNMQVISSLISLQAASIVDERVLGMLRDTRDRIRAMSLVHEQLYKSQNLASLDIKDYIEGLANIMLLSYQQQAGKVTLSLDVESIPMSVDIIMPCGLILNELISNSFKYAFPGDRTGIISISIHRINENQIEFTYSDNGIGLPTLVDIKKVESLGLRLINSLVTKQLGGRLEIRTEKETEFRITFEAKQNNRVGISIFR